MTTATQQPITFQTIPDWAKPQDGLFQIIVDHWWVVDAVGDPIFWGRDLIPQCNATRSIAERIARGRPVKQLPVVYVPIRVTEFWRE